MYFSSGHVPPTLNCDEPDLEDGCDLDYTPHTSVKLDKVYTFFFRKKTYTLNLDYTPHTSVKLDKVYAY